MEFVLLLRVNEEKAMRWCSQQWAQDWLVETYSSKKVFLKYSPIIIVNLYCYERVADLKTIVLIASNYVRFHRLRQFHKDLSVGQKYMVGGNHCD